MECKTRIRKCLRDQAVVYCSATIAPFLKVKLIDSMFNVAGQSFFNIISLEKLDYVHYVHV